MTSVIKNNHNKNKMTLRKLNKDTVTMYAFIKLSSSNMHKNRKLCIVTCGMLVVFSGYDCGHHQSN